ncbi:4'-phosphopantetheinyl transferase superfamily protein [Glutamicibacter soli]|uniref:4'-phosphopantetheinyl transferase superfamily protein n=1 Tax=Glutamicibacter soli TaxID=453836 RepID=A0A6L9G745_9MICC|nr:4'-phosphopantetheinyl transferase superfamily protein [Glutamicibacter soli]
MEPADHPRPSPQPLAYLSYLTATVDDVREKVAELGGYTRLLGPEASKAGTFKDPADAAALLASRALLRLLLARELNAEPLATRGLEITRHCPGCGVADHGQPRHRRRAVSLSRTREMVMAAVAPAGVLLGVDVERGPALSAKGIFPGFDDAVLAPGERAAVAAAARPDALRLALFSAKEALLKAAGVGLAIEPASFLVSADPLGPPAGWTPVHTPGVDSGPVYLQPVDTGAGHVASLACTAPLLLERLDIGKLLGQ